MKLTVVTGRRGELVALVHAHLSEHNRNRSHKDGPHATLRPAPGQDFHEVDAPDEYAKKPGAELRTWVLKLLAGAKRRATAHVTGRRQSFRRRSPSRSRPSRSAG
jgi:hypothetical protein